LATGRRSLQIPEGIVGEPGGDFPKDTLAMVRIGQDAGAPQRLVETVVAVNDSRKSIMARRVILACGPAAARCAASASRSGG
jgi:UDP-glucose 6-dehydrogenase